MTSDLGKWYDVAKQQERRWTSVSTDPDVVAFVQSKCHRGGRTPAVHVVCSGHETGWMIAFHVEEDRVVDLFFRTSEAIPASSLRVFQLKGLGGSASVRCVTCDREHKRELGHLLHGALTSLAKNSRVSGRFVVSLT